MDISALTFTAFAINRAMDTGRYDNIGIHDVKAQIANGTIFDYLGATLGNDIDLSLLSERLRQELIKDWQELEFSVNTKRWFGIENRGLPLLIAYLLGGVQSLVRERQLLP